MISPTYQGQIYGETAPAKKSTAGPDSGMGQDSFMKMFMAQVTHQNPLDPMDNTEFTAQLATFSQLEQLTKISKSMEGFGRVEEAMNKSLALGYIGKEVTLGGELLPVNQSFVGKVGYNLGANAQVRAIIKNEAGQIMADVDLGYQEAGVQEFQWDGQTLTGQQAPDGIYQVSLSAFTTQGDPVEVSAQSATGLVTGYQQGTDGEDYLLLGDAALPISKVIAVRQPAQTGGNAQAMSSSGAGQESDIGFMDFLKGLASVGGLAALL